MRRRQARHHPLLLQLLAEQLGGGCAPEDIVDFDLQLCDTQPAALGGAAEEFVFSGRLDNLGSCYTSLRALLAASSADATLATDDCVRMARARRAPPPVARAASITRPPGALDLADCAL